MKKKNKMLNLCQIYFEKSLMDKFLMRWKLFLGHLPSLLCHNFKYIYVISCSWSFFLTFEIWFTLKPSFHLVMVSIVYVLITLLLLVFPLFNIRLSQCDNLTRKKMSQFVNLMKMKLTSTLQAEWHMYFVLKLIKNHPGYFIKNGIMPLFQYK